jgi:4-hydroxy-tetrahydrodipicolinate synthase
MLTAFDAGEVGTAREVYASTLSLIRALCMAGGVAFGKAALRLTGLDVGEPRLPQVVAEPAHVAAIAAALAEAGVLA